MAEGPFAHLEGIDHGGRTTFATADPKVRVDPTMFVVTTPLPKDVHTNFPDPKDTYRKLQQGIDEDEKKNVFDSSQMRESVYEKLKRLRFEVDHFVREVSHVQGGKGKILAHHIKEESVLEETKKLESSIKEIEKSRFFSISANDQSGIQSDLLGGIKKIKEGKVAPKRPARKIPVDNETVVNIERRISRLEKVFGLNQNSEDTLYNVQEVLKNCEAKFSLMNPELVELLINKVKVVNAEVHKLEKMRKGKSMETLLSEDEENEEKLTHRQIGEVFEKVQKWDVIVDEIPTIVSRLKSLQDVHNRAIKFSDDISKLSLSEEELKKSYNDNIETLKKVEESFKKQIGIVEKNVKALDTKMNGLMKKLEKLEKM